MEQVFRNMQFLQNNSQELYLDGINDVHDLGSKMYRNFNSQNYLSNNLFITHQIVLIQNTNLLPVSKYGYLGIASFAR